MKCPKCGGNAELSNWGSIIDIDYADYHVECEKCGYHSMGSTEPQKAKEMFEKGMGMYYTNEQWLRLATTEQLAEWITDIVYECRDCDDCMDCRLGWCSKDYVAEWLKKPHTTIKE